jgi:hypothetical protein
MGVIRRGSSSLGSGSFLSAWWGSLRAEEIVLGWPVDRDGRTSKDNEDSSSGLVVPDRRKKKGEAACNCACSGWCSSCASTIPWEPVTQLHTWPTSCSQGREGTNAPQHRGGEICAGLRGYDALHQDGRDGREGKTGWADVKCIFHAHMGKDLMSRLSQRQGEGQEKARRRQGEEFCSGRCGWLCEAAVDNGPVSPRLIAAP